MNNSYPTNSGNTVHIPTSGTGPVSITISIHGPGGAFGFQPHGTVRIEHGDLASNSTVSENVTIGGKPSALA